MKWDILIVGAGISGSTLAERYASMGKQVLILEKRNHIGGNCYDYRDENGIRISKYGAHLFHTNNEEVWTYVNRFSKWMTWKHKVLARVDRKLVPIPVNIDTVNRIFGLHIETEKEMKTWLNLNRVPYDTPKNGKEAVLNKVGEVLYEKMFKYYTQKQWDKFPEELHASVLNRIPVRTDKNPYYFSDKYQALPMEGYTALFDKMLAHPNIEVRLNCDYFQVKQQLPAFEKVFYTGPIDQFFDLTDKVNGKLEYRSIHFELETLDREYFQNNSVINYPGPEVDFTRIIEYKHFGNQRSKKTTIVKEYSTAEGEPYYPVLNDRNLRLYKQYQEEAKHYPHVHFVGRLANYKYFNMDEAFKNALDLFYELEKTPVKLV